MTQNSPGRAQRAAQLLFALEDPESQRAQTLRRCLEQLDIALRVIAKPDDATPATAESLAQSCAVTLLVRAECGGGRGAAANAVDRAAAAARERKTLVASRLLPSAAGAAPFPEPAGVDPTSELGLWLGGEDDRARFAEMHIFAGEDGRNLLARLGRPGFLDRPGLPAIAMTKLALERAMRATLCKTSDEVRSVAEFGRRTAEKYASDPSMPALARALLYFEYAAFNTSLRRSYAPHFRGLTLADEKSPERLAALNQEVGRLEAALRQAEARLQPLERRAEGLERKVAELTAALDAGGEARGARRTPMRGERWIETALLRPAPNPRGAPDPSSAPDLRGAPDPADEIDEARRPPPQAGWLAAREGGPATPVTLTSEGRLLRWAAAPEGADSDPQAEISDWEDGDLAIWWAKDASRLALADREDAAWLLTPATAEPLRTASRLRSPNTVLDLMAGRLAVFDRREVSVLDYRTGRPLEKHRCAVEENWLEAVFFDAAAGLLALAPAYAPEEGLTVWDLKNGRRRGPQLLGHLDDVTVADWEPRAERLLTAGADHTARLWDLNDEDPAAVLQHDFPVVGASFDPAGRRIVTATIAGVRLWDAQSGELLTELVDEDGSDVVTARFDPSGGRLLTASDDGAARLWVLEGFDPSAEN